MILKLITILAWSKLSNGLKKFENLRVTVAEDVSN